MSTVVRFDDVSIRFILQHQRPQSLQELFVGLVLRNGHRTEEFWALRHATFEVRRGETLGIIGQNGSGKSTILKLITRILRPTSGAVRVEGKVSALIELGAGFHPDLTGRENIYLNGSILGLSRRAMDRLFEGIVEFSELERFIDTPVKHYSSGMYARLGFSVAISVDPDILIIDEVLSVGDEAFQRKCLERILDFRRQGKTIIFVSHGIETVEQLCDRVIWLDHGEMRAYGDTLPTIQKYISEVRLQDSHLDPLQPETTGGERSGLTAGVRVKDLTTLSAEGLECHVIDSGGAMTLRCSLSWAGVKSIEVKVDLFREDGVVVHGSAWQQPKIESPSGTIQITVSIPCLDLMDGRYQFVVRTRYSTGDDVHQATEQRRSLIVRSGNSGEGLLSLKMNWAYQYPVESIASTDHDPAPIAATAVERNLSAR